MRSGWAGKGIREGDGEGDGDKGQKNTLSYLVCCSSLPPHAISCTICDPVTDVYPSYFHILKHYHMCGTGSLGAH